MNPIEELEIYECPCCGGPGLLQEENGWCIYVECMDCGCHTAELSYSNEEERLDAAKRVAHTWNSGKVVNPANGD